MKYLLSITSMINAYKTVYATIFLSLLTNNFIKTLIMIIIFCK